MTLTLFSSPTSPYVRKVRVLIAEAGLTDRVTEKVVATTAFDTDAELAAVNPLGRIPALVREDGPLICDSRVICRYLDDLSGAGLYPADRLWEVLTLEALAEGILDSAVNMAYEVRLRPEDMVFDKWLEAQWTKIARTLDAIEADWTEALAAPLDAAQIALAAGLGYLDFRHDARGWRDGHPKIAAWYEAITARPSFTATLPG
ncbi:glutathione S-transferase [Pseudooceanicola marinus]|uniref:glutathione S-transferase n=1 Tax=Pseudooceanicola marinus TaxID=396013 RepID=UPI003990D9A5